ncbi:MAG: ABC transporter substrate-binding protein [Candidatus Nezhaarchaeota archaeon]|nr:ABC transporter substrate-binding protein [Candidatus Nezhaarchaeota archaeon]
MSLAKRALLLVALAAAVVILAAAAWLVASMPQQAAQGAVKTLKIGTTNIVKTDNYVKDYYMGIFASCFILDTLARIDASGKVIPHLVKWSTNDSRVWRLTLAANAKWHDGKPVTADDIAFTIMYLKEKHPSYAVHFRFIKSAVVLDHRNVEVSLDREWAAFPVSVLVVTRLMPKHVWSKVADPQSYTGDDRNVGCGPFIYGGFDAASGVMTFLANKDYWMGPPKVDKVVLKFYTSTDAMLMALKKGEVAVTYMYAKGVDPFYVPSLLEDRRVGVLIYPNFGVDNSLWFNCLRYPYNITEFRHAVSYALSYEDYVNYVAAGYAKVPTRGWIPDCWNYYVDKPKLVKNVTRAKEMLSSLGFVDADGDGWRDYPNGTGFTIRMVVRSDIVESLRVAELVKRDLEGVGIRVRLIPVDVSTFGTVMEKTKDFDTAVSRTTFWGMLTYADAGTLYFDSRSMGWANVADPSYHAVVDELLRTADEGRRRELYAILQDLYAEKMYAIPLYWGKIVQPYRSDLVDGLSYEPMYGILTRETWYSIVVKD